MHGRVKRTVLRFGSAPPPNSNRGIVSCGVPGLAFVGGCDAADASGQLGTPFLGRNTWDQSSLTLDMSQVGNVGGLPLTAICLAPDSPICTVDLWLATDSDIARHRLSPGNPLIGDDLAEYSAVALTAVASMGRDQDAISGGTAWSAAYALNHRVWDCNPQSLPVNDGSPDIAFTWPVRLELYYGDAIPNRRQWRAPYRASIAWAVAGAGSAAPQANANTEESVLWVCTDGRREWEVVAWRLDNVAADNEISIRVYGGDAAPLPASGGVVPGQYSQTQDWITWDEIDAGTFLLQPISPGPGHTVGDNGGGNGRPIRYSFRYSGTPYTFVKVVIETPHSVDPTYTGTAFGSLLVNAYD